MSMPALQEWLTAVMSAQIARAMTYPNSIDLSFIGNSVERHAREQKWPQGLATATLHQVHLPRWQTQACMPSLVVKPAAALSRSHGCDTHAMTYPLVMDPQRPDTLEPWQATFPVFDRSQV